MKFRTKTVLGVAVIEAVLLTILVLSTLGILQRSTEQELLNRAETTGKLLAAASRDALLSWDFATLDSIAREATVSGQLRYARFVEKDGRVLAQYGEFPADQTRFVADESLASATDGVLDRETDILAAGVPYGRVQFGIAIDGVTAASAHLRRWAFGISALEMVLVALFSLMLGLYLTRQLGRLRDASIRLAHGDMAHRIDASGTDELAETARAFNTMADRLQSFYGDLAERETRFREYSEINSDWFWETDKDERYVFLSDTFTTITKRSPDTLLGRRRWDLGTSKMEVDAETWQHHLEDLSAHRSFRDFKYWMEDDGGRPCWVKESGVPRFDDDGHFLGYRGTGSDITAAMENAHRMHMLTRAVEQSPVSVVITDLERRIQYVNPSFLQATGYHPDEVIGQMPSLLKSGLTAEETYQSLWSTLDRGEQWRGEFVNRRKDGTLYWEQASIQPIRNLEGRITNYLGIKLNITDRKLAEEKLASLLDELKRSNQDLEQFAYVASHDLKQPLRQISSFATLLERRLGPDVEQDVRDYLNFLTDGAKRMQSLVGDLLDYSRVSHRPLHNDTVLMDEALNAALALLTGPIAEAAATIERAPLPQVRGDRSQLERLLQNVVGNALKYRDPNRPPHIRIGCDPAGVFFVSDNGIGIPADQADRVFMIFQRLHSAQAYEGTGIGLAVCRKIVERHGGRIWLSSEGEGLGTTFFFTLPGPAEHHVVDSGAGLGQAATDNRPEVETTP
ncbi:PAS domain-containing sensor histidine kinase [Magnetospirillum sulfuroxidans]|uniref:histidine kinase n=1 Tax=Magnetospirillum sulfuroxidans TaxID=611300 RepID=A0ABS5IBE8_9PROT|nr:PAS domain-containing sensor histidine kinase [Magnetospirillum sulfuroxidans]MBR9971756.1 PAS domain S-box protein [Magnetospirillum sulfuroxidans]